jgi:hypothetical protein
MSTRDTSPTARRPDWLARLLAAAALAGLVAVWASIPAAPDPADAANRPLLSPTVREPCPLPPDADPTDVGEVMRAGFSPLMGRLMLAVVRYTPSEPDARRDAVIESTARLLGCVQLAAGALPASHGDRQAEYVAMMNELRDTVALLQLTAIENDAASSAHWFDHTQKQCARCHFVYKPAE